MEKLPCQFIDYRDTNGNLIIVVELKVEKEIVNQKSYEYKNIGTICCIMEDLTYEWTAFDMSGKRVFDGITNLHELKQCYRVNTQELVKIAEINEIKTIKK